MRDEEKDYEKTLELIYKRLPMFQRVGDAAIKKDLTNIKIFCNLLGNPQNKIKTLHIAGTNGKGSTAHMIASILQESGMKVGLYTSPHYKDFRERIKINGELISKAEVVKFVDDFSIYFSIIRPSFFEITVAMAFHHFQKKKVDLAIIETGLGGRLDSTNIVNPELTVITNISKDHTQYLGKDLSSIATEKAGIIKPHTPVIIGSRQRKVAKVFSKKAEEVSAPLVYADELVSVKLTNSKPFKNRISAKIKRSGLKIRDIVLPVGGSYQIENLRTALAVISVVKYGFVDWKIGKKAIRKGIEKLIKNTNLIPRTILLSKKPMIIADSAHNVAGMKKLMSFVDQLKFEKLHVVIGLSRDKNMERMLSFFPKDTMFYCTQADIPKAQEFNNLVDCALSLGLQAKGYDQGQKAISAAKRCANSSDLIVIVGSIYLVAELI